MIIKEFRVYAEVTEQGIDLRKYLLNLEKDIPCKLILLRKGKIKQENIVFKYRQLKNFDAFITYVTEANEEYPISVIEYSNSVRTDDHIMQRFDGIYWASQLNIPYIKFSSAEVNNKDFGGGNKIKIKHEYNIAYKVGAIFKHFDIPLIPNTNIADTNKERLSCPNFIKEFSEYLFNIINLIKENSDYMSMYKELFKRNKYSEELPEFQNSDRIFFEGNDMILKFNRFGHAMDPEKGMLYFFYCLGKKVAISFIMHRGFSFLRRKGYNSLFDGISSERELLNFVKEKNFKFNSEDYLYMFSTAISFRKLGENCEIEKENIYINDNILEEFLKSSNSQTVKSLFYFSQNILILGENNKIVFRIFWNHKIVESYYNNIIENKNYKETKLTNIIKKNNINEDLITYFTQLYFRHQCFKIASVSYPNAQGDRAILKGSGRDAKRIYFDLISYDEKGNIFLTEAKEKSISLGRDVEKLIRLKNDIEVKNNLVCLIKQIDSKFYHLNNLYVGVASKIEKENELDEILLNPDIDYAFGYMLIENKKIKCLIRTNNKDLKEIFHSSIEGEIQEFYVVK